MFNVVFIWETICIGWLDVNRFGGQMRERAPPDRRRPRPERRATREPRATIQHLQVRVLERVLRVGPVVTRADERPGEALRVERLELALER
jgi:hypothetical protein